MAPATLTAMKKVEVVVDGHRLERVTDLLKGERVAGYTVVPNLTGMGHHGPHADTLLPTRAGALALVITVVPVDLVDPIVDKLLTLVQRDGGVVFVSDVAVSRAQYFQPSNG